jgi:hypothetical protein
MINAIYLNVKPYEIGPTATIPLTRIEEKLATDKGG